MKTKNQIFGTLVFLLALISYFNLSSTQVDQVKADTIFCPNSSVNCTVTTSDGLTVNSEKGKSDGSVILTLK